MPAIDVTKISLTSGLSRVTRSLLEWALDIHDNKTIPFSTKHIAGLVPTNGTDATNDIDFSAGECRDSTDADNILVSAAMTKRMDATWAAGTGNGGHASGATAWGAATFHMFVLGKSTDPTAYDFGFDSSLSAANLVADTAVVAAGFDIYRRVGSQNTAGAAWRLITAREIEGGAVETLLKTPLFEFTKDWAGVDDAAQTGTLATVPGGIQVLAILGCSFYDASPTAGSAVLLTSTDQTDTAAVAGVGSFVGQLAIYLSTGAQTGQAAEVRVRTSTARTIRYRAAGSTIDHLFGACCLGYIDARR